MNRFFAALFLMPVMVMAAPTADKAKVLVAEIKMVDDQKLILMPAKVTAKIQSTVTADIEAHVVQILKPLGATVKSGEIVMYLENKDPSFTYSKVPVRSPIAGIVSQLMTTQMTKVLRGDKLFSVINPKSLRIVAEFSSADAALIKPGVTGNFKLNGISFPARTIGVSPLIDSRTGTASAELEFVSAQAGLPFIGSIGQISFEILQGRVLLVPENAISYRDGKPLLRIVKENNQIEKKSVELGEQRESQYIIKSGLQAGEKIVVRASRAIKDGETIEVEKSESH